MLWFGQGTVLHSGTRIRSRIKPERCAADASSHVFVEAGYGLAARQLLNTDLGAYFPLLLFQRLPYDPGCRMFEGHCGNTENAHIVESVNAQPWQILDFRKRLFE